MQRELRASRPDELWVVAFTYVPTWSGMAFTAFVSDVFSGRIVSYDNAMAESVIGRYKRECVRDDGPFRTVDERELAAAGPGPPTPTPITCCSDPQDRSAHDG